LCKVQKILKIPKIKIELATIWAKVEELSKVKK
jgi:hypothetical protein